MERRKRVYPAERTKDGLVSFALLAISVAVIASGFVSRMNRADFMLESIPEPTPIPMEETFDETMTEMVVELPVRIWYALQVGVYSTEETAQAASEAFQKRGAAGYLWDDGRFRVLASVYPAKEDARHVRDQLQEKYSIDSYLYEIVFPAVNMRLTGMQGQLELVQASFVHAEELAVMLQKLSVDLDRQTSLPAQIKERLNAEKELLELVVLRLKQRFPVPLHKTIQALIECFEDFVHFCSQLSDDASDFETSLMLKYQTFETLCRIRNIHQTLGTT